MEEKEKTQVVYNFIDDLIISKNPDEAERYINQIRWTCYNEVISKDADQARLRAEKAYEQIVSFLWEESWLNKYDAYDVVDGIEIAAGLFAVGLMDAEEFTRKRDSLLEYVHGGGSFNGRFLWWMRYDWEMKRRRYD